jgi:hypothetical protein
MEISSVSLDRLIIPPLSGQEKRIYYYYIVAGFRKICYTESLKKK